MQLQLLWNLQELDLAINTVKQKIEEAPLQSGVDETACRLEELSNKLFEEENRLKQERKMLKTLEMNTQKIVDDRKELSDNMYGGKISNVKELEQMQRKMELLAGEKKKLEDEILNLMESIEENEALVVQTTTALDQTRAELEEKKARLAEKLNSLNLELAGLEEKRNNLAEKIETKYMAKYKMLAGINQGQALAVVTDDLCGGCRVFISSGLRGKLYNPDTMVYCENCGRLLVRLENRQ